MADQVVMGPQREAGLSYVDSLYWGKGDNVFFAEDSNAPGGYNIAGIYNLATRKTVTIAGAIGDDNVKFNNVANVPAGSIHRRSDQELTGALHPPAPPARPATESALRRRTHTVTHTQPHRIRPSGWFDASASLTCDVDASTGTCSPQEMYDTQTSKHMILNNQMKGYGEGCMDYGCAPKSDVSNPARTLPRSPSAFPIAYTPLCLPPLPQVLLHGANDVHRHPRVRLGDDHPRRADAGRLAPPQARARREEEV